MTTVVRSGSVLHSNFTRRHLEMTELQRMMEKSVTPRLFLFVVLLLLPAVRGGEVEVPDTFIKSYNYEAAGIPVPILHHQYLLPAIIEYTSNREEDVAAPQMQQQAVQPLNSQAVLGMLEYLILLLLLKGSVNHIAEKYYASLPHIKKSHPPVPVEPTQNPHTTEIPFYGIDLPYTKKNYKNKN